MQWLCWCSWLTIWLCHRSEGRCTLKLFSLCIALQNINVNAAPALLFKTGFNLACQDSCGRVAWALSWCCLVGLDDSIGVICLLSVVLSSGTSTCNHVNPGKSVWNIKFGDIWLALVCRFGPHRSPGGHHCMKQATGWVSSMSESMATTAWMAVCSQDCMARCIQTAAFPRHPAGSTASSQRTV